jgi:hypothetical protein
VIIHPIGNLELFILNPDASRHEEHERSKK